MIPVDLAALIGISAVGIAGEPDQQTARRKFMLT